ncbi:MAG: hypothetical protein ABW101_14940 [Candidatus Thiodiazotropha sp.]
MRILSSLCLSILFFLSLPGTAMGFTVIIYTDRTEWENALAGQYLTEDFNDQLLNDGVTYTASESGHINVYFGYYQDVLMSSSQNAPSTIWTFVPQIIAYGGTWTLGGPGGSGNSLYLYIDGNEHPVAVITNSYNDDFLGIIADAPFTSVTLMGGTGSNQQSYKLDDMVYSPVDY